jgi:hypothetical protein
MAKLAVQEITVSQLPPRSLQSSSSSFRFMPGSLRKHGLIHRMNGSDQTTLGLVRESHVFAHARSIDVNAWDTSQFPPSLKRPQLLSGVKLKPWFGSNVPGIAATCDLP